MSWTVDEALAPTCEPRRFLSEYRFTVGELWTTISIKLWKRVDDDKVYFTQSHFIKTPSQAGPYTTSINCGDDEGSALHRAVDTIVSYYDSAVREGHAPEEDWLVSNTRF